MLCVYKGDCLRWLWGPCHAVASVSPPCLFPHHQCMLIFIIGGLVILAYCSQASNERTYQEVVWAVCGKVPGVLCEVAIAVYTFGTCIAFLIIIGDQEDKSKCVPTGGKNNQLLSLRLEGDNLTTLVVPTVIAALVTEPEEAGSSRWYTDRKFTISITAFLLILPLSIPKEIGFQKYARWVGRARRGLGAGMDQPAHT